MLFLHPFLQAHDLPTSRAIAAGLLWYGCMLVVSMLGAPAFAVGQRHRVPERVRRGRHDRGARVSTEVERRSTLPGGRVLSDGHVLYWWVEILLVIVFYVVYSAVRNLHGNSLLKPPPHALDHAMQIISLEHHLGIFHEATIQDWALHFRR